MLRNVGKGPALVVFLVDVGKGALAVLLAGQSAAYITVSLVTSLMVLWRHRSNIQRLIASTEPRISQKA